MSAIFLPNGLQLLGWGNAAYACKVTEDIALKRYVDPPAAHMSTEYLVFDLLEQHPPCPDIVRSFLRLPGLNFMQLLPGGSLEARLRAHQTRDPETQRVVQVTAKEPYHLTLRWRTELVNAVAWLESLSLSHGDIRPSNLLLDSDGHLKLTDFDNTVRVGGVADVGTAPYARLLGLEAGADRGTSGFVGPRTEQFAIGSVYYYLLRGFEPYDNVRFGEYHGRVVVEMLQRMEFPELEDENDDDAIIRECWHGGFASINALALAIRSSNSGQVDGAKPMAGDVFKARQEECRRIISDSKLRF